MELPTSQQLESGSIRKKLCWMSLVFLWGWEAGRER